MSTVSPVFIGLVPISTELILIHWVLGEVLEAEHLYGMGAILVGLLLIDGRLFRRRG